MPEVVKKVRTKPEHPPFGVMIAAAITALKERKGSSRQAIGKYVCANYKVGLKYAGPLKLALKRGVETNKLVQTKGVGASGSFKVAKAEPEKKPKVKKPAAKKVVKKPAAKKAAPKKAAPKKTVTKKTPTKKAVRKPPVKKQVKKAATPKKKPVVAKKPAKVTKRASPKKAVKKAAKK